MSAMKTALTTAAATSLALVLGVPAALADGPRPSSGTTIAQSGETRSATDRLLPHYEWQYHYVGRHARLEGYWAPVR
jgi:hypothetical protein